MSTLSMWHSILAQAFVVCTTALSTTMATAGRRVFVAIIMLSLIGIGAYFAVELLERRVLHYLPKSSY